MSGPLVVDPVEALTPETFDEAQRRVAPVVHRTPILSSATLSSETGYDVLLKAELFQRTGSYKIRGPSNKLPQLTPRAAARAASSARRPATTRRASRSRRASSGIRAVVVMAENATPAKIAATQGYGAEVVLHGRSGTRRTPRPSGSPPSAGSPMIHPFDDVQLIAGQGTIGLEILETFRRSTSSSFRSAAAGSSRARRSRSYAKAVGAGDRRRVLGRAGDAAQRRARRARDARRGATASSTGSRSSVSARHTFALVRAVRREGRHAPRRERSSTRCSGRWRAASSSSRAPRPRRSRRCSTASSTPSRARPSSV